MSRQNNYAQGLKKSGICKILKTVIKINEELETCDCRDCMNYEHIGTGTVPYHTVRYQSLFALNYNVHSLKLNEKKSSMSSIKL